MQINSGNKNVSGFDDKISATAPDLLLDESDEAYLSEISAMQGDEGINLDDALDDDNENPVSQTLVGAAENSGFEEIRDAQELEGEEEESKDRVGSLSPLYREIWLWSFSHVRFQKNEIYKQGNTHEKFNPISIGRFVVVI